MRLFLKLVFGFAIVLTLAAGAAAVRIDRLNSDPIQLTKPDRGETIRIGDTDVIFHFSRNPDDLELYVMIVSENDLEDVLQTRIRMRNGQVYSLIVRDENADEDGPGDQITFIRSQDAIIAHASVAQPGTKLTSLLWPFG